MRARVIILAAFVVFAASSIAVSQNPPELQPLSSNSSARTRTPLALEIFYNPTLPPAYLMIEGPEVDPHWIWFTRFSVRPGWQPQEGTIPIRAVRVKSQWNGETADVKVSLLRGLRGMDQEEVVTSYQTGVDESKTVSRLENYGIEPFRITLMTPKTTAPPLPNIENGTKSIEIVKIESEATPLPAYRVSFRNLSDKKVVALQIYTSLNGAAGPSAFFQGEAGSPLIDSNQVREEYLPAHLSYNNGGTYGPAPSTGSLIRIFTVVFTDGSFEGDVSPACMYETFVVSRMTWVKRMLSLFDEQLRDQSKDIEAAMQLKQKIAAQTFQYSAEEKAAPSKISTKCLPPAPRAENLVGGLNLRLLNELDVLIKTRPKPLTSFRPWLEKTREIYRTWLTNLESFRQAGTTPG